MDRRNFLKTSGVTAACLAATSLNSCSGILDGTKDISIKDVKDSYKTQLVVVGGGPAGVCAAIAAARKGVKAMILEQGGCLGGMATRGLVAPFMTCYDTEGEQQIIRGLFEEVVQRMVQLGGAIHLAMCVPEALYSMDHPRPRPCHSFRRRSPEVRSRPDGD